MRKTFWRGLLTAVASVMILTGCQSAPKTTIGQDGLTYTNTIHDIRLWIADDFNPATLSGKSVAIAPTASSVPEQTKDDEIEQFERLRRSIADQLYYAIDAKGTFSRVAAPAAAPSDLNYRLDSTIIDYYPGNAALRFTVGFGAGFPSITLAGNLKDQQGRAVLAFETQREFEARPFEYTDEQILQNNIKDLAVDVAQVLDLLARGKPLKK